MKKFQNRKTILFSIISLILISFITYREILGYYFTGVDTFALIWAGQIRSYKDILRIFSILLGGSFPFYRPISQLSYGIDHLIWGDNPFGYHLTDLLLHSLNTVLVFWLALVLFRDYKRRFLCAWLAAFLFSISPINLNVVPSITNRHDMIAGIFLIVCLLAASKSILSCHRQRLWYMVSISSGALSIFSKESTYVLPFILGSYCFIYSDGTDYMKRLKLAFKYAIPLVAAGGFNIMVHLLIKGGIPAISKNLSLHIGAVVTYVFHLVDPIGLFKIDNYAKGLIFIIFGCGFVIMILFFIVKKKGGSLELLLGDSYKCYTFLMAYLIFFSISYLLYGRIGGRYTYMPNIAFAMFIAGVLFHCSKNHFASSITKVFSLLMISYIVFFSPLFTQHNAWNRSSAIVQKTIDEIKRAVTNRFTGEDKPTIYLLNLPLTLEIEWGLRTESAGILINYNMVAWAKMSESKDFPYVKYITLSYARIFDSPHADPVVDYRFDDNRIYFKSKNVRIIPLTNSGREGDEPIRFSFKDREGELTFKHGLRDNELLVLFDVENIKIIDAKWLAKNLLDK